MKFHKWRADVSLADQSRTTNELLGSILADLDGYVEGKWKPARMKITKQRIVYLVEKARND